jgi:hypothetical protein
LPPVWSRFGWSGLAAAAFALVALAAVLWALDLRGQLDDDDPATAVPTGSGQPDIPLAYIMRATTDGPADATGVLFPDPSTPGLAQLTVRGLAPLAQGEVYQLWFLDTTPDGGSPTPPQPSVTFTLNAEGIGTVNVPLPAALPDAIGLTREPPDGAGDAVPNVPVLMTGAPGTAAG